MCQSARRRRRTAQACRGRSKAGNLGVAELLLRHKAHPDGVYRADGSPLLLAQHVVPLPGQPGQLGRVVIAPVLMQPPIMAAIARHNVPMLQRLCAAKANLEVKARLSWYNNLGIQRTDRYYHATPLIAAVRACSVQMVQILVGCKADLASTDSLNHTALRSGRAHQANFAKLAKLGEPTADQLVVKAQLDQTVAFLSSLSRKKRKADQMATNSAPAEPAEPADQAVQAVQANQQGQPAQPAQPSDL